ncbi:MULTISPECIES: MATE family efflux transporter [Dickeya]|uniref:Multi antimicrobial extrusion protein (Na(+)/drug antiporter), MATE family of MDR efflux pumps n=1 Tax=Dickeya aquatica TaxID=1401087 RepID=A0A375AGQ0_9GAMM|nr:MULTISPECIES: MATE family efflux transporter [Dickeya]SLM65086.1 Multi antimicrobial extrusion protein (Na(+)/drug antiporter), MATE family of MDR efflux pumps [Dickeya aquatica]
MSFISRGVSRAAPAANGDIRHLFALAWPMMITAVVVSLSQNLQIAILGNGAQSQTLLTLSFLQPFNFLFIAIMECLAITNQVFSARSRHDWPRQRIRHSSVLLAVVGVLATLLVAGACWLLATPLAHWMNSTDLSLMRSAAPGYLVSMTPFLALEVVNAALRGQGRTVQAMSLMCGYVLFNAAVCYLGFHVYQLGFDAVLLANSVPALLLLPWAVIALRRAAVPVPDDRPGAFIPRLIALLADAGIPVFFSMLVVFFSSMALFPLVAKLGEGYLPAFLIVIKLRAFFIIPAVAIGSALAILFNQRLKTHAVSLQVRLLNNGVGVIALVYLLLTLGVCWAGSGILAGFSNDATIRLASQTLLVLLLPTFFLTSLVAALQTLLEQLGRGRRVLLFTVLLELSMVAVALVAARYFDNIRLIALLIVLFNLLYATVFLREYRLLAKGLGERDAAV